MWKLFAFVVSACLLVGAGWESKPFEQWTAEDAVRVLTNSPWAHEKKVDLYWYKRSPRPITYKDIPGADHTVLPPIGSPVGGIGGRPPKLPQDAKIVLRWTSALPLRQATAAYKRTAGGQQGASVASKPETYVLEMFNVPAEVAHAGAESVEAVARQGTQLITRSGRLLRPSRTEVTINGLSLTVRIHFAGSPPITEADGEVEIVSDMQIFTVKDKFKLGDLRFGERLEL